LIISQGNNVITLAYFELLGSNYAAKAALDATLCCTTLLTISLVN
jgi:hypothetical protein